MQQQAGDVGAKSASRYDVERLARERLASGFPYERSFSRVSVHYDHGTLTLDGRLPSFYAKQLLQEKLRGIRGISHIENNVEVGIYRD